MLLTNCPMKIWRQVPANAMVIFSSNSAFKLSIHLQCRALIIPRAGMKAGCIKCSNERDFSSSFPVRYIPRKNLESGESEGVSPARFTEPSYSSNEQLKRDVRRVEFSCNRLIPDSTVTYRVESKSQNERLNFGVGFGVGNDINCEEQFEDDSISEEPEEFMHEVEVSEEKEQNDEYSGVQGSNIIQQGVENLAVKLLAKRSFTAAELKKKLLGKHFPLVIVDAVILDFQKRGLVNDSLYAENYSRSRWATSTWGPRRIKKALLDKGVNNKDVEKAVKLVISDTKSAEDEESVLGMSQHAMNHLFVQASKQWLRSVNMPIETRKSRIIMWLQYRGFSWEITSVVLKKLVSGRHL